MGKLKLNKMQKIILRMAKLHRAYIKLEKKAHADIGRMRPHD